MLPNEEFALACLAYYEEQGLIVDKTNGEFAHCPLPRGMGETGYYLLWEHHQQQGLLQSRDVGRRCFWVGYARQWLEQCDYWPDNYFELWDIYEEFTKEQHPNARSPQARKKATETRRRNGTMNKSMEQCHTPEAIRKRVEVRKRNGSYRANHLHKPEVIRKAVETRKRNGTYPKATDHMQTPEIARKRARAIQKPVEITFPNGRIGVYSSLNFASLAIGFDENTIRRWFQGKHKSRSGHSARYL